MCAALACNRSGAALGMREKTEMREREREDIRCEDVRREAEMEDVQMQDVDI